MNPNVLLFIQVSFIVIIYGILAYAFYLLRSMKYLKSQKKKFEEIHRTIAVGKKVVLSSGLIGMISSIEGEILKISLNNDIEIESSIYSVQSLL